jgi:hypothetical protein
MTPEISEVLRHYPEEQWPQILYFALSAGLAIISRLDSGHDLPQRQQAAELWREGHRQPLAREDEWRQHLESGLHDMLASWEERMVKNFRDAMTGPGPGI